MVMDLAYSSVQKILPYDKDLRQLCNTWIQHHLTTEQMATCVESCQEWLKYFANDPNFFDTIISCN